MKSSVKVHAQNITRLEKVYAVGSIVLNETRHFIAASEDHERCILISPPDWRVSTIWTGPGGTMQIVPLEGGAAGFLAIQKFFPVFKSEEACIVHAAPVRTIHDPWKVKEVCDLPFAHRMHVVMVGSTPHVVASTLCGGKEYQDDWSKPGGVYAGPIPPDPDAPLRLKPILEGVSKNHGMHVTSLHGRRALLISGAEGIFQIAVPDSPQGAWNHTRLVDREVSDIYVFDIDGDGKDEILSIEPFHGDNLVIYREIEPGNWKGVFHRDIAFGHVVWGGFLRGNRSLIYGCRGGAGELALMTNWRGSFRDVRVEMLEEGAGPAAIVVVSGEKSDLILSAQHETDGVTLYEIA